jgi:hypothetical protein
MNSLEFSKSRHGSIEVNLQNIARSTVASNASLNLRGSNQKAQDGSKESNDVLQDIVLDLASQVKSL